MAGPTSWSEIQIRTEEVGQFGHELFLGWPLGPLCDYV